MKTITAQKYVTIFEKERNGNVEVSKVLRGQVLQRLSSINLDSMMILVDLNIKYMRTRMKAWKDPLFIAYKSGKN